MQTSEPIVRCEKRILTTQDLEFFLRSRIYTEIVKFIEDLSKSIVGKELVNYKNIQDKDKNYNKVIYGILDLLDFCEILIDETPPIQQPMRFGNKAFQIWYDKFKQECPKYLENKIIPETYHNLVFEVSIYITESFGNRIRVDYGTGHELNFILFLYSLVKLKIIQTDDYSDLVLVVFYRYLLIMRRLQMIYLLEPAGSRGVWGLDDYHFLPFLFGSAQLMNPLNKEKECNDNKSINKDFILPGMILDSAIISSYSDKYLYLNAVQYILQMKSNVHFGECSPVLYSLTSIPTWSKIYIGMLKMYKAEILNKLPVVQHIVFSNIIKFS
ncbi:phosphotyrosyl phosphate activator protein [Cryptosporidium serpentis]